MILDCLKFCGFKKNLSPFTFKFAPLVLTFPMSFNGPFGNLTVAQSQENYSSHQCPPTSNQFSSSICPGSMLAFFSSVIVSLP